MLDMVNREHLTADSKDTRKPWKWMIVDAIIIGGIAALAAVGNTPPGWAEAWIMFKAFGASFLLQLAVERGLKRPSETQE